jgi:flagellar basal-body rod modification protein FlgD
MPPAIDSTLPSIPTSTAQKTTGPQSLSSSDFMTLMLKQLQSQDPMNPTDSNALLQQIAQISTLQSNQSLQTSLSTMTLQQTLGAAGNLIGKAVQGVDDSGNTATGAVKGVRVQDKQVYLQLDNGSVLPMANVVAIAPATALAGAAGSGAAPSSDALSGLMSLLSSLGLTK